LLAHAQTITPALKVEMVSIGFKNAGKINAKKVCSKILMELAVKKLLVQLFLLSKKNSGLILILIKILLLLTTLALLLVTTMMIQLN
jgi:hypothetical protein